jgi:hypothetical protein
LIRGDNLGIRFKIPFLLLSLNQDKDAYNFIKWWVTIGPQDEPATSHEGEWLYLKNQDIFENIFSFVRDIEFFDLHFLAALVLIKARIIQEYEFANEKNLSPLPFDETVLREQKHQLKRYLNAIQRNNRYFLKAVVNPDLVMDMEPPEYFEKGTVSEVYGVIDDCKRIFARNKVAMDAITKIVGKNPTF